LSQRRRDAKEQTSFGEPGHSTLTTPRCYTMPMDAGPSITTELKLAGERIALVGRLASMSRVEADKVVAAHGGVLQSKADESTTLLVKGDDTRLADVVGDLPDAVR